MIITNQISILGVYEEINKNCINLNWFILIITCNLKSIDGISTTIQKYDKFGNCIATYFCRVCAICNCVKICKYLMIKCNLLWPSLASSNHQNTAIYIILDSETTPVWLNPFELEFPAFYATWHSNRFNSATPLKKCGNIRLYRSLTKLFFSSGQKMVLLGKSSYTFSFKVSRTNDLSPSWETESSNVIWYHNFNF